LASWATSSTRRRLLPAQVARGTGGFAALSVAQDSPPPPWGPGHPRVFFKKVKKRRPRGGGGPAAPLRSGLDGYRPVRRERSAVEYCPVSRSRSARSTRSGGVSSRSTSAASGGRLSSAFSASPAVRGADHEFGALPAAHDQARRSQRRPADGLLPAGRGQVPSRRAARCRQTSRRRPPRPRMAARFPVLCPCGRTPKPAELLSAHLRRRSNANRANQQGGKRAGCPRLREARLRERQSRATGAKGAVRRPVSGS